MFLFLPARNKYLLTRTYDLTILTNLGLEQTSNTFGHYHAIYPLPFHFDLNLYLSMQPDRSQHTHDTHLLGSDSPAPTFSCIYCPRYFHSKSGRTKHIRAKHGLGSGPQNPNLPPSPVASSPYNQDPGPPIPIPADAGSSDGGFDLDGSDPDVGAVGSNVDSERSSPGRSGFFLGPDVSPFSRGYVSPGRSSFGRALEEDEDLPTPPGPAGSDAAEPHVPDSPHVPRVYHTRLDGMLRRSFYHVLTLMISCRKDL